MSEAPVLIPRLSSAFDMAREVHNASAIEDTELPYLLHLLDVCSIALRHGADEDQAIAALLHDVVEDGGGAPMLDEIREGFGDRVADIVLACSDSLEVDRSKKPDWWVRKITYIDHLRAAPHDVALVSGADKLSNARSLIADHADQGDALFDKFRTGRVGTLWYYRRIAEILPARLPDTDGARRLGGSLRLAVHDLVDAVGSAAAEDWRHALAEEQAHRDALAG
jgi:(p)ppGpp synthase/HD superfamily hydrolase